MASSYSHVPFEDESASFAEHFRATRFEEGETHHNTRRLVQYVYESAKSVHGSVAGAITSSFQGNQDTHSYALIRSDIDDDGGDLPTFPGAKDDDSMARKRTRGGMSSRPRIELIENDHHKPLPWVDGDWFQWLSGLVILINAITIGLEGHISDRLWQAGEHTMLVFFCIELFLRLARHREDFFSHDEDWAWNWFDFTIVITGIIDEWMLPVVLRSPIWGSKDQSALHQDEENLDILMRLLRLVRILRLFRLVRVIRPLRDLVQGVAAALQGMLWVLVFMVMTLYSAAILCTRLIGHGDSLPAELSDDQEILEIRAMFSNVPESMFSLFGTMSSWSLLKFVPLFDEFPVLKPLFVVFYIYSAWALLAVMTGVVSENMIAIREQMQKEDVQREELRRTLITKTLLELFQEADVDHSGTVSRVEFDAMLKAPELVTKITKNTNLKVQDLQDLFDWLDHDGGGSITIDEFMVGFKWVNEPLRAKSLVKLQERLANDVQGLGSSMMKGVDKSVDEVRGLVTAPIKKVHAITEQVQSLDFQFRDVKDKLREQTVSAPKPEEYAQTEARLHHRFDQIFEIIEDLKQQTGQITR